jgi:signal transduction histidine kinase
LRSEPRQVFSFLPLRAWAWLRLFAPLLIIILGPKGLARAENVLVLYENNRLLPANIEADRGLNEVIAASGKPVQVRAEFLDYPEFGGDDYVQTVATYLREKYKTIVPDVIVVGGNGALDFILKNRARLFPDVPVVHMGIEKDFVGGVTLPAGVYGVPVEYDAVGTIAQALKWHPQASRLVVVTGLLAEEKLWLDGFKKDIEQFHDRLKSVEYLTGLATDELRRRVGMLDHDTIIFTTGYYKDGTGRSFTPRQAASEIANAASVPVYGPYNTFVGVGVVGGKVPTFLSMGKTAGSIVNHILAGRPVEELKLPQVMPTQLSVDWRQIERWGIDPKAVPADALVQFRAPGFWDQYRTPALIMLGIVLLQSALVGGLLIERRRRLEAENAADKHRFELAHASRLAVAGELTASIAHEINQPLGAIQSNVTAATLLLEQGKTLEEIRPILEDIRRDNVRASEVIRQLRKLLEKHEVERKVIDLNDSLSDAQTVLRAEAQRRRVELRIRINDPKVEILGDRIQIQQILINLVLNAMDAVSGEADGRRIVTVTAAHRGEVASVEVKDTGHGIETEDQDRLFESFFSTKPSGIGLGLSIVRTLVEAHLGKVWAENQASGGAVFRVTFPSVTMPSALEVA